MINNSLNQTTNQIVLIKEKALHIVKNRGPLLPVQITKELGVNVMFASALLSELVDSKTLKISNTKIGGSPVYYVSGQEPKLQSLRDKLNDKQQKAFDMLKQDKLLRDSEQEPVIRLALRDIKDFAHQLQVTSNGRMEIFWKWYLTQDSEVEPDIRKKLELDKPKHDVQKEIEEIERNLKKLEERKQLVEQKVETRIKDVPIEQKVKEDIKKPVKVAKETKQNELVPETPFVVDQSDKFMVNVMNYFKLNNIEPSTITQIRRDADFECIVKIPSAVGSIAYFCKAKNKKKLTDSDLSLLYVQSQMKKMPVLVITTGDLTKKAQELLTKEFKNITIKKI